MTRSFEKCYICNNKATSKEHVPPRCIFPEPKDVKGLNYRNNLITVPSCDKHNSQKSQDDEFLLITISKVIGSNKLAHLHSFTKVERALSRKRKWFYRESILRHPKLLLTKTKSGKEIPIIIGQPDFNRLIKCFEQISHGLFFHEYGYSFAGEIKIIIAFTINTEHNDSESIRLIRKTFENDVRKLKISGNNPKVFKYQFCIPDDYGIIAMKMTFYENSEVYVAYKPEGKKVPFDLIFALENNGFPTTIVKDGDKFEFNNE